MSVSKMLLYFILLFPTGFAQLETPREILPPCQLDPGRELLMLDDSETLIPELTQYEIYNDEGFHYTTIEYFFSYIFREAAVVDQGFLNTVGSISNSNAYNADEATPITNEVDNEKNDLQAEPEKEENDRNIDNCFPIEYQEIADEEVCIIENQVCTGLSRESSDTSNVGLNDPPTNGNTDDSEEEDGNDNSQNNADNNHDNDNGADDSGEEDEEEDDDDDDEDDFRDYYNDNGEDGDDDNEDEDPEKGDGNDKKGDDENDKKGDDENDKKGDDENDKKGDDENDKNQDEEEEKEDEKEEEDKKDEKEEEKEKDDDEDVEMNEEADGTSSDDDSDEPYEARPSTTRITGNLFENPEHLTEFLTHLDENINTRHSITIHTSLEAPINFETVRMDAENFNAALVNVQQRLRRHLEQTKADEKKKNKKNKE